jgi:lipopolysaccharide heptosyltransferase II
MHILVFKQGGMGDLLMASPGLRALRKSLPQAHISFAVGRSNSRVLDNNPYIDELIEFDDDYIFKIGRFNQIKQAFRLWRRVRRLRPDAVVILHRDLRWNLLFFLAGVPNRYGFDRYLNGAFLTKSAPALAEGHEIEKYLRVFALVDGFQADGLIMDLFPTTEDEKIVENLLAPHIGGTMVALAPGGAQNIKESRDLSRWPLDRYRTLVEKILAQTNLTVVLIGGPDDRKWTESLCLDENRVMDTAGRLTVQQSYLVLKACRTMVTHDCGPMHIGAAAEIPIVALFGTTHPNDKAPLTDPLGVVIWKGRDMDCSPCYHEGRFPDCSHLDCMRNIEADEVLEAIKGILKKTGASGS